jgi:hypothetical protein
LKFLEETKVAKKFYALSVQLKFKRVTTVKLLIIKVTYNVRGLAIVAEFEKLSARYESLVKLIG